MNKLTSTLVVVASILFAGCAAEEAPPEEQGSTESQMKLGGLLDEVKDKKAGYGKGAGDEGIELPKMELPDLGGGGYGGFGEGGGDDESSDKLKSILEKFKK